VIKIIATVRRKPGMTHEEYCVYLRNVHGEIARAKPLTVRRYIQSHVFDGAFGVAKDLGYEITFHRDSVTELWFDDLPAMARTFSDPYTQQVIGPDGANFGDLRTSVSLLAVETELDLPKPGSGAIKVMHFLKSKEGFDRNAWVAALNSAVRQAVDAIGPSVRRAVLSVPLELPLQIAAYFKSEQGEVYDGVTALWFDEGDVLPLWRTFLNEIEARNIANLSRSFFVMTREVNIFDFTR
jgi:EthD domain